MAPEILVGVGVLLAVIVVAGFVLRRKAPIAPPIGQPVAPEPQVLKTPIPPPAPAPKLDSETGRAKVLPTPPLPSTLAPKLGGSGSGRVPSTSKGSLISSSQGVRIQPKSNKSAAPQNHPETIGKYELLEVLGEGGMATVYHGRDTNSNKDVAIKLIHDNLRSDSEFSQRFEREIKVSRALVHPNIVQMLNKGEQDGKHYLVMELMDGGSLDQLVDEPMDVRQMVEMGIQIAGGLHYAHERGLVHRDIKPSNIMLNGKGIPKILDFGLALGQGMARLTQVGMAMGTPTHMAPEVLTTGNADARSDQYSLGVVFYQMLAGRPPFEGTDAIQVGLQHVKVPPPSLRALREEIPAKLETIILKMLAKKPDERFESMAKVKEELESCLS